MLKIVLSFDDGRRDNFRAAEEILKPLNIPATFNITTGYILQDIDEKDKPGPHDPMTLRELEGIARCHLFEIAGHGYKHNNDINNLLYGVQKLRELLPGVCINGVASPHSEFDLSEIQTAHSEFLENDIYYLRISNDYTKMNKTKIWLRRFNRIIHSSKLYKWVNIDSIEYEGKFLLHSFPVIRDNKLKEIEDLLDSLAANSIEKDQICILMFHSILKQEEKFYSDLFTWDYDDFKELCAKLNRMQMTRQLSIIKTVDLFH